MSGRLKEALEQVARRFRRVRLWGGLAACWLVLAIVGLALARMGFWKIPPQWTPPTLALLAMMLGLSCALAAIRSARDPRWVARRIESHHPDLGTELLAAVEQVESAPDGRLGFLQSSVVREALEHRESHDWDQTVPGWQLVLVKVVHAFCLAFLMIVLVNLTLQSQSAARGSANPRIADASEVSVEPGDVELERGTALLVVARFHGEPPPDAALVLDGDPGEIPRRPMTRALEDPTFAGRVESVQADLSYHVAFGDRTTPEFHVRVFEYPELKRADAHLDFPAYTGLKPKLVEDIRHVTAVEGTTLTLICRLNKEVAKATLVDKDGASVPLVRDESPSPIYKASFKLEESRKLTVRLVDREGRSNPEEPQITIHVTRNKPPTVRVTRPSHDVDVSPLEELQLAATMEDDFGLVRQGLSYAIGGDVPKEIVLGSHPDSARPLRAEASHMLALESMKAVPDQLVSYFFWAEDIGPDGQLRRTAGDMFFAEVRPFEEIFRQGEQPSSSAQMQDQNGNAQRAEQLAELQKQIINATWKVIRRETRPKPTETFVEDVKTLRDSQKAVLEQASPLGDRLRDSASKAALAQALDSMRKAHDELGQAATGPDAKKLMPSLAAEQNAYQSLLRLRARESQVVRSRSRQNQSSRSSSSRSRRQLDQLELAPDENRFEEQRSAQSQQEQTRREQEQAENRQVLNRLRELAQRQKDLNERLKELQAALEAAKTQQAREEWKRQLQRLRDQQEEILRDTDELRQRMEQEQNQERMAEARQQLEQGRENLQQASRALEQGNLPQAQTAGARAGQQLEDLREKVRKQNANQFAQEMTQLRNETRKLDNDQKKINDQLDAWEKKPERSLRESDDRRQLRQAADDQKKKLDQVLDRMRATTQQAEDSEPLLARGLYDAVRQSNEQHIPEALDATRQFVDAGFPDQANRTGRQAGEGLEQLRQNVERAADSVLGDETAALRRARNELDDLANQVNREIAQNQNRANPQSRREPGEPGATNEPNTRGNRANEPNAEDRRSGNPQDRQADQPRETNANRANEPNAGGRRPDNQQNPQQGQQPGAGERQDGNANRENEPNAGPRNPNDRQAQQPRPGEAGNAPANRANEPNADSQNPGNRQGQQNRPGEGQRDGQPGDQRGQGQPGGQQPNGGRQGGGGNRGGLDLDRIAQAMRQEGPAGPGGPGGPITGEGFRQWSDRMRDVEELIEDPEWRAEAARIRDRVRGAREEVRRHSREPDWNKLQNLVTRPINELRQKLGEELARRESPDSLVPIDRDPVPPQYAEGVRRYYERLSALQGRTSDPTKTPKPATDNEQRTADPKK